MSLENTYSIIDQVKKLNIKNVSLGFSTGKDSLIGLDLLLKSNINVVPIYFYIVPGISFIEENIRLYEKFYSIKVIRLPHPMFQDFINRQPFQPLHKAKFIDQFYNTGKQYKEFSGIMEWYFKKENINIPFDVNCMKMADSLNRRLLLRNKPDIDIDKKIIYLGKYLKNSEIFSYLKENKIPLTKDYELFGRSADNLLNYQYLIGIEKAYPNDFKLIKEYFPMCELELLRYKKYIEIYG